MGYVYAMTQDAILHMRVSAEFEAQLADLRKSEPDLPSKSEMIRRLVERAVEAKLGVKHFRPDSVLNLVKSQ